MIEAVWASVVFTEKRMLKMELLGKRKHKEEVFGCVVKEDMKVVVVMEKMQGTGGTETVDLLWLYF